MVEQYSKAPITFNPTRIKIIASSDRISELREKMMYSLHEGAVYYSENDIRTIFAKKQSEITTLCRPVSYTGQGSYMQLVKEMITPSIIDALLKLPQYLSNFVEWIPIHDWIETYPLYGKNSKLNFIVSNP